MTSFTVENVLSELENAPDLLKDNWCVSRETGRFLYLMALTIGATHICEIGTSIGYSTLWLAQAAQKSGGNVDTLEYFETRQKQAISNIERGGFSGLVTFHLGQAAETLEQFQFQGDTFDFAFIDAAKKEYIDYVKRLEPMLIPGSLLIADNTRSHREEMQDFLDYMEASPLFDICDLETPSGQLIARKR